MTPNLNSETLQLQTYPAHCVLPILAVASIDEDVQLSVSYSYPVLNFQNPAYAAVINLEYRECIQISPGHDFVTCGAAQRIGRRWVTPAAAEPAMQLTPADTWMSRPRTVTNQRSWVGPGRMVSRHGPSQVRSACRSKMGCHGLFWRIIQPIHLTLRELIITVLAQDVNPSRPRIKDFPITEKNSE
jgi:hypothetical protein